MLYVRSCYMYSNDLSASCVFVVVAVHAYTIRGTDFRILVLAESGLMLSANTRQNSSRE